VNCCCQGVDEVFGERTARHDLERYRRRGLSKPTRRLVEAVRSEGIEDASVLDIGGGVGAIQYELLEAGAARATAIEAASAYVRVAREESQRRGLGDRITHQAGDFVELADGIEPADVVTLDRVICCYPDMESLVARSAERARRVYAVVYPQDRWWVGFGIRATNLFMRVTRRAYRAYLHRTDDVDAVARAQGLTPRLARRAGPIWQVAVYVRVSG
jgi:methyltransferase family protein